MPLILSSSSSSISPNWATAAPWAMGLIRGRINWGWPPILRENADATVRTTCHTASTRPVVADFIFLMRSTALSFRPLRSHRPMAARVSTNRVAVRLEMKELPSVSRISMGDIPATRPVTRPATTTVAMVSNFRTKPTTTTRMPISFSNSIVSSSSDVLLSGEPEHFPPLSPQNVTIVQYF